MRFHTFSNFCIARRAVTYQGYDTGHTISTNIGQTSVENAAPVAGLLQFCQK